MKFKNSVPAIITLLTLCVLGCTKNSRPSEWVQMTDKCKAVANHYCNVEVNQGQCQMWSQAVSYLPANEPAMPPRTELEKGAWLTVKNCSNVFEALPSSGTTNGK